MKKFLLSLAAAACAFGMNAAEPLYAAGDFQGWNPDGSTEFTFANGVYTLEVSNSTSLKISTACGTWDDFNAGALQLTADAVKGANALTAGDANILLPWTGDWTLTVSEDLTTLTLDTETPEPVGPIEVYVRGDMTGAGWAASPDFKFTQVEGSLYKLEGFSAAVGECFKIADANWGKINWGGTGAMAYPGTEYALDGGDNIVVGAPIVNTTLWLDLDARMLGIGVELASVKGISVENGAAEYFNMQGVRVSEPTNGMYIVRRGNQVTKEIVRK